MQDSHGDLAALLKSWRDRLSPLDVGLPGGGSLSGGTGRRALGLRREELAALAGLSVDYVIRLEQGRARNPSAQVAAALARALQATDEERDHLFRVAGLLPPSSREVPRHIPPGVQRLVARLGDNPIAVFTASWDLITWTPLWTALLRDPLGGSVRRGNLLRSTFGDGPSLVMPLDGPERFRASLVADLRRVQGRYPEDRHVQELIDDLLASSPEFRALWETGAVGEHRSEVKTIDHPVVGPMTLDCDVFSVAGSDLRIVAYTVATGTPDAEKLDFLRVSAVAAAAREATSPST